ncbi:MAG TPA: hypothetical protein VN700_15255 [Vicinamibacterales bacterium]|nr:hypothetical protein [Vicinamibacterales bacterium]
MAVSCFRFKPADTRWIGIEVYVTYSCDEAPKVERKKITGLKQISFIVGYEYDVDAFVHKTRRVPCTAEAGCNRAVLYECDVKVFVSDTIGLGIGVGKVGTGTLGWPTESTEEMLTLKTDCVCCDDEGPKELSADHTIAISQAPPSAISWFVGFGVLGAAVTAAELGLGSSSVLPVVALYGVALGTACAAVAAGIRLAAFFRRRRRGRDRVPVNMR